MEPDACGGRLISVCIPVYNESSNVRTAVDAVRELFRTRLTRHRLQIIITDNCSTDRTWDIVRELAAEDDRIRGYRFSRNFGYQNSVYAGLCLATGDAVVELDADLEDPPEVIEEFVRGWEEGNQIVYGVRERRHTPLLLRGAIYLFYRVLNVVSDAPIPADAGDFRLMDRKCIDVFRALPERHLYLRGLVSVIGFRQKAVSYRRNPRHSGASKFRLAHYCLLALDAVTGFSRMPLRLIGLLGLLLFVATGALGLYYLVFALISKVPVPGFATIVVLMLFLSSLNFIFLGILGEYLGRLFEEIKHRPRLIIEDAVNDSSAPRML